MLMSVLPKKKDIFKCVHALEELQQLAYLGLQFTYRTCAAIDSKVAQ